MFSKIVSSYENMYEELSKSRPQLSVLTDNIQKAYLLSSQIDEALEALYSLKKLDFALVELYFAFVDTFPVKLKSSVELKKKLAKAQISQESEDVRQMALPCLEVNSETGKIEDFNKEAMKLLRVKRF